MTKNIIFDCFLPPNKSGENSLEILKIANHSKLQKNIKKRFLHTLWSLDLSYRKLSFDEFNKIISKLQYLRNIQTLIISSYFQIIDRLISASKLHITTLEIINEELHEKDFTTDILNQFAKFNPYLLHTIKLKKCKINKQCIVSLNKLKNLRSLSFEKVEGLSNTLIRQISLNNLNLLAIIDNDEFDDNTCMHIIKKNKLLIVSQYCFD